MIPASLSQNVKPPRLLRLGRPWEPIAREADLAREVSRL